MTPTVRMLFRQLLKAPGDVPTMFALADALAEAGEDKLERAYRYAAERKIWPRSDQQIYPSGYVGHDWNLRFTADCTTFNKAVGGWFILRNGGGRKWDRAGGVYLAFRALAEGLAQ